MEKYFKFSIQTLLSQADGKVSGPMSPFLFAQEMGKATETKFNRLARVWFDDETINQFEEDGSFTGHDTLLIGTQHKNDLHLTLWVDTGIGGVPVAMVYQSDREVVVTPVYQQQAYVSKLSEENIREIFNSVFDHPEQIAIIQK